MSNPLYVPPASNEPMILAKEDWPNTDQQRQAEVDRQRADRLAAKLRDLGLDPDQ